MKHQESQIAQEQVEKTGKLTNFTRLSLDFVSNDPAETEVHSITLAIMTCVLKHTDMKSPVPVNGADAWHAFVVTHTLQQQPVSDLPGEHGGVSVFQVQDSFHNSGCGHFGLGASNHSWSDASCLIVPGLTIRISVRRVSGLPCFTQLTKSKYAFPNDLRTFQM